MSRVADAAAVAVADRATACRTVLQLTDAVQTCSACPELAATRTRVVAGDFPTGARLMLVGEAPGAQEDLVGRPFVGKAGALLDQLLSEAGLSRGGIAVANTLKCRPPSNRTPTSGELSRCRGWLDRQVDLVDPSLVVTLGGTALTWALGPRLRLRDAREQVHAWRGRRLVATYHPSAAIRFGPRGAPMAALRADLQRVAELMCAS